MLPLIELDVALQQLLTTDKFQLVVLQSSVNLQLKNFSVKVNFPHIKSAKDVFIFVCNSESYDM